MSSERVKSVNTPTLKSLQRRWQHKTGEPMPEWIARLDLPLVERAVKDREAGNQVVVPAEPVEARDGFGCGDSMREWDTDSPGWKNLQKSFRNVDNCCGHKKRRR